MKKLMTIAAMFAAVMTSFTACEKNGNEGGNDNGGNDGPEIESNAVIQCDGDYSDWEGLEGVVVATCPADDVLYEQFKTFKVYADEEFIHIFCEFNPEETLVFVPYFDLDNNPATGNTSKWSGAGYEAKAEGSVFEEVETEDGTVQGAPCKWDPNFYHYTESGTEKVLASGMAVLSSVPAPYKNGNWAFEASQYQTLCISCIFRRLAASCDFLYTYVRCVVVYAANREIGQQRNCVSIFKRELGQT